MSELERQKRLPGLSEMGECTCQNLRKAARAVTQYYEAALEPSGLKVTQLPVLAVPASRGPLPMSRLADELVMDRTTLTRNLRPLEKAGLIRVRRGEDKRARIVEITDAGRAALAKALPLWKKAQAEMVDNLGRFQWGVLMDNLRATVAAVKRD